MTHVLLPCTPTSCAVPSTACMQAAGCPPPPTWSSSASTPAQACRKRWWCCCTTDSTCSTAEATAAVGVCWIDGLDWRGPCRLRRSTPYHQRTPHTTPPRAHLFRACCQQCPQVLACVVDGLLTQLTQVGGQEALDSEGGVLKGQQRARAVAQQLGQLCVAAKWESGWVPYVLRAAHGVHVCAGVQSSTCVGCMLRPGAHAQLVLLLGPPAHTAGGRRVAGGLAAGSAKAHVSCPFGSVVVVVVGGAAVAAVVLCSSKSAVC